MLGQQGMALLWTILSKAKLIVVVGTGPVTKANVETYLRAIGEEGTRKFSKIVDLTLCKLAVDRNDLDELADAMNFHAANENLGPIAIAAYTPLNIDVAALLWQRINSTPVRIFADVELAIDWLMGLRGPQVNDPVIRQLIVATFARLRRRHDAST